MHGFGMGQDMAGVMEKFQSCWREGDAVAVPFDQGQGKLFSKSLIAVLRLGWEIFRAWAAAEMELCLDNSRI